MGVSNVQQGDFCRISNGNLECSKTMPKNLQNIDSLASAKFTQVKTFEGCIDKECYLISIAGDRFVLGPEAAKLLLQNMIMVSYFAQWCLSQMSKNNSLFGNQTFENLCKDFNEMVDKNFEKSNSQFNQPGKSPNSNNSSGKNSSTLNGAKVKQNPDFKKGNNGKQKTFNLTNKSFVNNQKGNFANSQVKVELASLKPFIASLSGLQIFDCKNSSFIKAEKFMMELVEKILTLYPNATVNVPNQIAYLDYWPGMGVLSQEMLNSLLQQLIGYLPLTNYDANAGKKKVMHDCSTSREQKVE